MSKAESCFNAYIKFKHKRISEVFSTFLLLSLVGCGGGSGDSSQPAPTPVAPPAPPSTPDLVFTVNTANVVTEENQSVTVNYSVSGAQNGFTLSFDGIDESVAEITDNSDQTFTVSVGDILLFERSETLNITATDGDGRTASDDIIIDVKNTSSVGLLTEIEQFVSGMLNYQSDLGEPQRFLNYMHLLASAMPDSKAQREPTDILVLVGSESLSDVIESLSSQLDAFRSLQINEYELSESLTESMAATEVSLSAVSNAMNEAYSTALGENKSIPFNALYSVNAETLSMLIGNLALGQLTENGWQFNDEYQFLNDIAFPEFVTCEVE